MSEGCTVIVFALSALMRTYFNAGFMSWDRSWSKFQGQY